jgi:hypothetical protein
LATAVAAASMRDRASAQVGHAADRNAAVISRSADEK